MNSHRVAVHSKYGANLSLLLKNTAPDLTGAVKQIIKTHGRTRELTDDLLLPTAYVLARRRGLDVRIDHERFPDQIEKLV
jgi:hypothetical protein